MIENKIGRNQPCPCGSGLKYKKCCGKESLDMKSLPLLQSINIQNFRSIQNLEIEYLSRVNLIAGNNSVGKTAALEAIFLLIGAENLELILKISHFRGIGGELKGDVSSILDLLWSPLFYGLETDRKIKIFSRLRNKKVQQVELSIDSADSTTIRLEADKEIDSLTKSGLSSGHILTQKYSGGLGSAKSFDMRFERGELRIEPVPSSPPFPGYFLSARRSPSQEEAAILLGKLVRTKKFQQIDLVKILETVEPRIRNLEIVPNAGYSMIYGDIGLGQMIPLSLMGDGMSRLMGIILRIANAAGGIVLIDEIENGLHYSILEKFWHTIHEAAVTFDCQIIATTHSYDCIRAAHKAFSQENNYSFRLHRLDRVDNHVNAVTYDQEALDTALNAEFEVR